MMRNSCRLTTALFAVFAIAACTPLGPPTSQSPTTVSTTQVDDSTPLAATPIRTADSVAADSQEGIMPDNAATQEVVTLAKADLADHLSVSVDGIELLEVRAVTWPDASLGCAEPGQVYAQVAQEGFLIRLRAGEQMYFYHSGPDQRPFLCERTSQILPNVTPTGDEFVPPPDSDID